ncbi:MAG: hypothetical protein E7244_19115, partial [Enterocloster citroniae]|nr:hypothetical protein [Enterocloster citroniae]
KIHSRHLHAPLRGIFGPNSVSVAHYASFIGAKSPTKCDAQLTESNFQTRPSTALHKAVPGIGIGGKPCITFLWTRPRSWVISYVLRVLM